MEVLIPGLPYSVEVLRNDALTAHTRQEACPSVATLDSQESVCCALICLLPGAARAHAVLPRRA